MVNMGIWHVRRDCSLQCGCQEIPCPQSLGRQDYVVCMNQQANNQTYSSFDNKSHGSSSSWPQDYYSNLDTYCGPPLITSTSIYTLLSSLGLSSRGRMEVFGRLSRGHILTARLLQPRTARFPSQPYRIPYLRSRVRQRLARSSTKEGVGRTSPERPPAPG